MLDWLEEITSEDYETDITETNITSEDRDFRIVKINENMLVMFEHCLVTGRLLAQPLTIITETELIRLLY